MGVQAMEETAVGGAYAFDVYPYISDAAIFTYGMTLTSRTGITGSCEIAASLMYGRSGMVRVCSPSKAPGRRPTPGVRSSQ